MPPLPTWPPSVHHRKDRGTDFIILNGKRYTLGAHGSAEARQEYLRLVTEAEANGGRLLPTRSPDVTVAELVDAYVGHAETIYEGKQLARVRSACAPLVELYGRFAAADLGGPEMKAVQAAWAKKEYCRRYCNDLLGCVKRMFRWAVVERLVPATVANALSLVPGIRRRRRQQPPGAVTAPDRPRVKPADPAAVERTLPHLRRQVADMVRLQLLTGARPGEVAALRPCDVRRDWKTIDGVSVWLYSLDEHKNDWRGHERHIPIGPQAQAILAPYLEGRAPDTYCFCPKEAREEWLRERSAARKTPRYQSHMRRNEQKRKENPQRAPGRKYSTWAYDQAVRRACATAGVEPWTPNQLRHTAATEAETDGGREDSRARLGHRNPNTTGIYAEILERAARVAARLG